MLNANNFDQAAYVERRARLGKIIGSGIALIPSAPIRQRNSNCNYPYRGDSYFLYLTGFEEPEAILLLDTDQDKSILFCREKQAEREIWDGFCYGPSAAREVFEFDEAYPIDKFEQMLPRLLANHQHLHWRIGNSKKFDKCVAKALKNARKNGYGLSLPKYFHDISLPLNSMRLIKDRDEIALLNQAGEISALAHQRAMCATKANMFEYQIEAEILHTFLSYGARSVAYESIVASGVNACTLHYVDNCRQIQSGELVLIDAGCEIRGYAGDITRTFPVNGRFSGAQRAVYEIVLAAQLAAIANIKPGAAWNVASDAALKILVQGMLDLNLLTGTVDSIIESGSYKQFYMHGIGHWIGLDVHDVGGRILDGKSCLYKTGMCTTVEPGLYIRAADNVPTELHNIGVRIEDNILLTESGNHIYTDKVAKGINEIEELMKEHNSKVSA